MRLVVRLEMESEPESASVASSDLWEEEDPEDILDELKCETGALESGIQEIAAQLEGIVGRIQTQTRDTFHSVVSPRSTAVRAWMAREGLEDRVSLEAFLEHLFRIALALDMETRTILFSKEAIEDLGIPAEIGLYDLIRRLDRLF